MSRGGKIAESSASVGKKSNTLTVSGGPRRRVGTGRSGIVGGSWPSRIMVGYVANNARLSPD